VALLVRHGHRQSEHSRDLGKIEEFPRSSAKHVELGGRPVLVVRKPSGEFSGLSAVCTHLDCIVSYSKEHNRIECPCHRGIYDLDGANVSGPPPRPLDRVLVTVRAGHVIVGEG